MKTVAVIVLVLGALQYGGSGLSLTACSLFLAETGAALDSAVPDGEAKGVMAVVVDGIGKIGLGLGRMFFLLGMILIVLALLNVAAAVSLARNRRHTLVMSMGVINVCIGLFFFQVFVVSELPHFNVLQMLPAIYLCMGGGLVFWVARTAKRQKHAEALATSPEPTQTGE